MALNKEAQKKILKLLKLDDTAIAGIVDTDTEVDPTTAETGKEPVLSAAMKVYTPEEYTELEKNLKEGGKTAYINAGKEIAIKDLKEKTGLEYDGKDAGVFLQKLNEKILADAKVAPNEAVKVANEKITALQNTVNEYKGKLEMTEKEKAAIARDTELLKKLPANRDTSLSDEDRLLLLKNKLVIDEVDGKPVYKYKGEALRTDTQADFTLDEAVKHVFAQEKWIAEGDNNQQRNGRGDHSQRNINTGKPMKLSEAEKQWEDQGKKPEGAEFQAHVLSLKKENTAFDLDA